MASLTDGLHQVVEQTHKQQHQQQQIQQQQIQQQQERILIYASQIQQRFEFFRRILTPDTTLREKILLDVQNEFKLFNRYTLQEILHIFYPSICRLALNAPFQDIRNAFAHLMIFIQQRFQGDAYFVEQCTNWKDKRISEFVKEEDAVPIDVKDDAIQEMFQQSFLRIGRVPHIVQLLAWHPPYLRCFRDSVSLLMVKEGPLPLAWRNYLAIMASSRYQCEYIASMQQQHFLIQGGNAEWLQGLSHAPEKLAQLHELNVLLAHQPWLLTRNHITQLLTLPYEAWSISELVHAIIILCCYHSISSLALGIGCLPEIDLSFMGGCEDEPSSNSHSCNNSNSSNSYQSDLVGEGKTRSEKARELAADDAAAAVEEEKALAIDKEDMRSISRDESMLKKRLVEKKLGLEAHKRRDGKKEEGDADDDDALDEEPFQAADSTDDHLSCTSFARPSLALSSGFSLPHRPRRRQRQRRGWSDFRLYAYDSLERLGYEDFDVKNRSYSIFHTEDYSWSDHCFAMISRYLPSVAQALDEQFTLIKQLTYHSLGDTSNSSNSSNSNSNSSNSNSSNSNSSNSNSSHSSNSNSSNSNSSNSSNSISFPSDENLSGCCDEEAIDTSPFRMAVWYYVHRIFGVNHDDYNYREVNVFVNRPTKHFIKKVACYPWLIQASDFEHFDHTFTVAEKCHVVLLASEARKQAGLLYGMRAVMKHLMAAS